jgi:hypothetical protein
LFVAATSITRAAQENVDSGSFRSIARADGILLPDSHDHTSGASSVVWAPDAIPPRTQLPSATSTSGNLLGGCLPS